MAVGAGALGLVWLGLARWGRDPAPTPPNIHVVSTFARPEAAAQTAPEPLPAPPAPEAAPPEPEPVTPPAGAKLESELPVYGKLLAQPLSHEPHQILGAWDEDAESSTPGQRRAFVIAVSPGQSDTSLAALARDVRAQNRDAALLDVRIYDDAGAAISPRMIDSGRNARLHLVAEIQRNDAAGLDVIRVRGRALEP